MDGRAGPRRRTTTKAGGAVEGNAAPPEPWPTTAAGQIQALQNLVTRTPCTVEEALAHFAGARRELVTRHLETLELMGGGRAEGRYGGVEQPV